MTQLIAHVGLVLRDYDEAIELCTNKLDFDLKENVYQPAQDKHWVVVASAGSSGVSVDVQIRRSTHLSEIS